MATTKATITSLLPQDENKGLAGKALAKKPVVAKRAVLGDISNASNKVKLPTKAEPKQPVGMGRVPIFPVGSSKPAVVPPVSSNAAVGSLTTIIPPVMVSSSATTISSSALSKPVVHQLRPALKVSSDTSVLAKPLGVHQSAFEVVPDAKPMDIDDELEDKSEDIDIHDLHDPQCCTEYVQEIFEYCREKESKDAVPSSYMSRQVDINEKMRGILIDWMVEVHVKFKLLTETMFLAVNVIDRFLAQKPVARQRLQLVGITAMLMAAKYEEIFPPEVRDFVHISDNAYPREEILKMERLMLTTLDFNLSTPTPLHFLRRFSKAARSDSRTHTLSKYLTELTLVEYKMLDFLPSQIAAAAVYIARRMTCREPYWTPTLEKYTTYSEEDLMECALALNAVAKRSPEKAALKAVRKKYLSVKLLEVAKIPAVDF